ncbi:MAG TPA: 2-oxoglutarate dehydrogenase complex dihydrolipoyllysine-residue succinyltransferase [Chitinophagaceae bacterium]|nr:2-oxoglutarate dehydrogenase complex dihydrolipoyllysine-residue succinyltransferase [Chitinophagaceae bacterium]
MTDITVPTIGESITEATITKWLKQDGDYVARDEVICELESEKASFELPAEQAGILKISAQEGDTVEIGAVIAQIDEKAAAPAGNEQAPAEQTEETPAAPAEEKENKPDPKGKAGKKAPSKKPAGKTDKGVIEMKVPTVGESINEVTLVSWRKGEGDYVERDEVICELESEKATFELNAEEAGTLQQVGKEGDTLQIGDVVAKIDTSASAPADKEASAAPTEGKPEAGEPQLNIHDRITVETPEEPAAGSVASQKATPVAAAMMADKKVSSAQVHGSGAHGKIVKFDVLAALEHPGTSLEKPLFSREERREKMSNLRKTISRRLVEAKNNTAMLTTFNEVDMNAIMAIRKQYKEKFKEVHEVGLGFMSFFSKACCFALQEWPAVNAYLDGTDLLYHNYCDISIAVSTPRGLVVPVIRNAESMSMADIEKEVVALAKKARDGKLSIEEMTGGTFTITNGGVFGSLMSTPILNPPQSAILGMHKIEQRPKVVDGQVVVRPMMYIALSYDHRVIDGSESVSFLVRVKELLEHPEQLLFGKDPVSTLLQMQG